MTLHKLFKQLARVFDGNLQIEKVAKKELTSRRFEYNFKAVHSYLPKTIQECMEKADAHIICKDILKLPFNWAPPQSSKDPIYRKHSTFKSHVELLGPNGLIKSEVVRLGFYGMLPNSEYGIRTHPAEELYIMLAGDCLWKVGNTQYKKRRISDRSYHPAYIPHASKTQDNAFMAVYVWYGNLSTEKYFYEGIS